MDKFYSLTKDRLYLQLSHAEKEKIQERRKVRGMQVSHIRSQKSAFIARGDTREI